MSDGYFTQQDLVLIYLFFVFTVICILIWLLSPSDASLRDDCSRDSDSSSSDRRDTF